MKYSKMISIFGILSIAALIAGCEGKPKKAKILTTTTSILVDEKSGSTASGASVSTSVSSGSYTVTLPTGLSLSATPSGAFTGITYQGSPLEASGFVAQIPDYGQTSSSGLGSSLIGLINASVASNIITDTGGVTIISSNSITQTGGNTTIYHLAVSTTSSTNVTGLSNILLGLVGVNSAGGTVTNLPSPVGSESSATTFHVVMQVSYSSTCPEVVGIGVSTTPNYSATEALLSGFLDGTNTSCGTVTKTAKTDSFSGAADPKADFVWVVDDSGSMSGEQTAVQNAATAFFSSLTAKRLDYRIGVIKTSSSTLRNAGGTDWVTNSTSGGQTAFTTNVAVGTAASVESAIYFAEQGLNNSTLTPRSGAKLYFVFVSDEGDNYQCRAGGSNLTPAAGTLWNPCQGGTAFNTSNNIFTQNGYKVFGILGVDAATGNEGKCTGGNGTQANDDNNQWPAYQQLITATGGSMGSICASDFSPIMSSIVTEAAATGSPYVLSKTPISSTIAVKVAGSAVTKSASNGWSYDSGTNSILFSGTAWPAQGSAIEVTYEYNSSSTAMNGGASQTLTAFIGNTVSSDAGKIGLGVLILAGLAVFGRNYFSRKNQA